MGPAFAVTSSHGSRGESEAGRRPPVIMHVLEPAIAGVPAYVDQLGRLLAERGIRQIVVTSDESDWPFEEWAEGVVRVPWARRSLADMARVGTLIHDHAQHHAVDIVHAHATFAGIAVRIRRHSAHVVYQPHGWGHLSTARWPAAKAVTMVERVLAKRTDLLLTLSAHELRHAPSAERVAPVEPLPNLEQFTVPTDDTRRALRSDLGWSDDDVVHLCVGEFSMRKNQRELVAEWLRSGATDLLALVGDGAVPPEVPPEAEQQIIILGWRDDVDRLMQAADSLVVASRGEGFSLVILEALATGLPVFTTDVGGSEVVTEFDGAVRQSVREVVVAATTSPLVQWSLALRRARSARHRVAPDEVADSFVTLYESMLA